MSKWLLSVPTLFGLESLAAREIRMLGYDTELVEDGRVSFYGDERAICRANIWLRTAERVQIKLGDFIATSFTELFDQTKALQWPELLPRDAEFPVNGHCLSSKLGSVPDCQSIIKKAVVESMKSRWNVERFSETGPLYRINFNIIRDRATIYVDTSGEGLHKRGYRESAAPTPIKETLASALVELSRWRPGKALWDPFCGSGTITIEAAMMAANRAPGLTRKFASENWTTQQPPPSERRGWPEGPGAAGVQSPPPSERRGWPEGPGVVGVQSPRSSIYPQPSIFKEIFAEERQKAQAAYEKKLGEITGGNIDSKTTTENNAIMIVGSDLSRQSVRAARQNASEAGVSNLIRFFQMDAKQMDLNHPRLSELGIKFPGRGCIVTNPPYGVRHDDKAEALEACGEWAPALSGFYDWNWCIISAIEKFEHIIGRNASKRRKLNNGKIKCQAYMYW